MPTDSTIPPTAAPTTPCTRLAPSPTGALHLGNARTFLVNWALARKSAWRIVLRIEDLDGPRIKPDAAAGIIDTLRWLGIDWDDGPFIQSHDLSPYRQAMAALAAAGAVYPSEATRSEIESAASAPQEGVRESVFTPAMRPTGAGRPCAFENTTVNWRFVTPEAAVAFTDLFAGPQRVEPARTIGDFVVWTRRCTPAYQLAVVVDDHRQHITHVVRGDDLLDSAARQLLVYRALGSTPEPAYMHLPLVVGTDGRRLAKRHGDTRVETYRARAVPPEAAIGLIAHWCGIIAVPVPMNPGEFKDRLDATTIPRRPIIFTPEHDRWLLSQAR